MARRNSRKAREAKRARREAIKIAAVFLGFLIAAPIAGAVAYAVGDTMANEMRMARPYNAN